ncbi:MAG TPA: DUF1320 domain-containing protein [Planctomycetota bacterium]|nr:DUF1320 domain-containing protein [Planctomycetota bacterium]HUX16947.1 DUF1320 domain-containing protein [Phycisphaerae bacterium]
MAIVTQQMLADRIGDAELIRVTDDGAAGVVDTDVLARAVEEGEGELLNAIGQRYTLPLGLADTNTAAVVRAMMLDAVVYRLYMHRDQAVSEEHLNAYRHAVEWASRIAAGKLGLVGEAGVSESPAQGGQMIVSGSPRVVSRETMRGV